MPPKPKFSKDEIIAAALDIVREKGIDALTARELGARLGSSARPIFTVFASMDEVAQAVREEAQRQYDAHVRKASDQTDVPAFKAAGQLMLSYAKQQPKLFSLLFMHECESAHDFADVFASLGDTAPLSIDFIRRDYGLTEDAAMSLFKQLWVFTYGLSVLCATGMCVFSDEELSQMLTEQFTASIKSIKAAENAEKGK